MAKAAVDIRPQGDGGFDCCWYPVAIAADVPPGTLLGRDFLDGRVVVFRGASGEAHVVDAFCRHLGADLSVGRIVGDEVECAFHRWRYDGEGRCRAVPSGDPPPAAARLRRYRTAESMGLIWAFNGDEPGYDTPKFAVDESRLQLRAYEAPNILPVDPIVQMLNAFDLQHFQIVHGLDLEADDFAFDGPVVDCTFRFTAPELGRIEQVRRVWGTSAVTMNGDGDRPSLAAALCPVPGNRTRMYVVNAVPVDSPNADAVLDGARDYALRLIAEDWPILRTIRFRPEMLVRSDAVMAKALRWAAAFPRSQGGSAVART